MRTALLASVASLFACLAAFAACSSNDDAQNPSSGSTGGGAGAAGMAGTSSGGQGGTAGGQAGSGGSGANLGGTFARGINPGYNPPLDDAQTAQLAFRAGCNSSRLTLPERHLQTWGWEIETGDMASYAQTGLHDQVVFLIGPSAEHSTMPAGGESWQLDQYIPKNLYEPIFLGDGQVNPDNYWATYVAKTVQIYMPWIKVWSVWNEPDYVSDWQIPAKWATEAPTAEQLIRFHGSIFDYVRMLRITSEVAHKVDPEARVAVGGLGYPTFLAAILRYSDNPDQGKVTTEYPKTGKDYFDVVDMHYYPIYTPGTSDAAAEGLIDARADLKTELDKVGKTVDRWIVTETAAPSVATDKPGGPEYARNYLLKAMIRGQADGFSAIHWFALSNGEDTSTDPYSSMGLYSTLGDRKDLDTAVLSDTGVAYKTLGAHLNDARFDPTETSLLALPAAAKGAAFRVGAQSSRAWVLWARTGDTETASASVELATTRNVTQIEWDESRTPASKKTLTASSGKVQVQLTGTPSILLEN